jgi:hypothetical protein
MSDFEMFSGDSLTLAIDVTDGAGNAFPLPDGTEIKWWAARSVNAPPNKVVIQKDNLSGGGGATITDENGGLVEIELVPEDTEAIRGALYHEMQVILPDGSVKTTLDGTMTIKPDLIKVT